MPTPYRRNRKSNKRIRKKKGRCNIVTFCKDGTSRTRFYKHYRDKIRAGQTFTVSSVTLVDSQTINKGAKMLIEEFMEEC